MVVLREDGGECRCFLDEVPAGSVGVRCRSFHPLRAAGCSEHARVIGTTLSVLATNYVYFTSLAIQRNSISSFDDLWSMGLSWNGAVRLVISHNHHKNVSVAVRSCAFPTLWERISHTENQCVPSPQCVWLIKPTYVSSLR